RPEPLLPRTGLVVAAERDRAAVAALGERLLDREAGAVMVAVRLGRNARCAWSRARRAGFGLVVAAGLAAGAAGCDYFRPGKPELSKVGSAIVPNYRQEDSTLAYLARGIEDKGRTNGLSVYIGGFADTTNDGREFHAFFDAQTVNRMQQRGVTNLDWDRGRDEQDFYPKLVILV